MAWSCQMVVVIFMLFSIQTHHFWINRLAGPQLAEWVTGEARPEGTISQTGWGNSTRGRSHGKDTASLQSCFILPILLALLCFNALTCKKSRAVSAYQQEQSTPLNISSCQGLHHTLSFMAFIGPQMCAAPTVLLPQLPPRGSGMWEIWILAARQGWGKELNEYHSIHHICCSQFSFLI